MTEADTEFPVKSLNVEEREKVIRDWEAAFETRRGEIVKYQKVVDLLEEVSSPEAFGNDSSKTLVLPGSFSFGANPELFHTVYSHLCAEEAAGSKLEHEREHRAVFERHGVPVEFGIVISKLPDGRYYVIPLISSRFPEDMLPEQRKAIAYEAILAATVKSEMDARGIKKHEQGETGGEI